MEPEDFKKLPVPDVSHESKGARKKVKKDLKKEKNIDHVTKSLADCTLEENVDTLCTKNSDEVHNLTSTLHSLEWKLKILKKEKELIKQEQIKEALIRSKLENLYSELQKQNIAIKNECAQKKQEEVEKLRHITKSYQSSLREALDMAHTTIKEVEIHYHTQKSKWANEIESLKSELKLHEEQNIEYENINKTLEKHITQHINKLSYYEITVERSNEMFDWYQAQINSMRKQIQDLEQVNNFWKDKLKENQHEEKSSVSDSVNTEDLKIDLAAQSSFANDENKQNENSVCVNVTAQDLSNDQLELDTESMQSVKHEQ